MIQKGYCRCGCGEKTPIAKQNYRSKGIVKGKPVRFVPGHNMQVGKDFVALRVEYRREWEQAGIDYGLCLCGCGRSTRPATQTSTMFGWIRGEPRRFCNGHSGHKYVPGERAKAVRWLERDCGYETPCWVWQLYICKRTGYAKVQAEGRTQIASRFYYEERHGKLPRRVNLDHLCRNRSCVNPDHLEQVTNAENCRRGRNTKLTADEVREIRRLCAEGMRQADVGRMFGVTQANVSEIHRRKSWADLL